MLWQQRRPGRETACVWVGVGVRRASTATAAEAGQDAQNNRTRLSDDCRCLLLARPGRDRRPWHDRLADNFVAMHVQPCMHAPVCAKAVFLW